MDYGKTVTKENNVKMPIDKQQIVWYHMNRCSYIHL